MAAESREQTDVVGIVVAMPTRLDGSGAFEPWLDERGLARHYAVSTRTVRRWRVSGMPSRVFGRVRRYRVSDCDRWHTARGAA
jgi:hypothetical protein